MQIDAHEPEFGNVNKQFNQCFFHVTCVLCKLGFFKPGILIVKGKLKKIWHFIMVLFVLRFYGPVNPVGSCRVRSVYLTTRLLGRLSPLSG